MDRPLFVYGTLCDPDLLAAVIGRRIDPRQVIGAVAPGFRVVPYPDRIYPALVRAPGGRAEGLVLLGLSRFERDVLDVFEGAEYTRAIVPVVVEDEVHEADAYLPTVVIAADAPAWTLARWQRHHKPDVLASEGETGAEIRARLIAARPH